MKTTMAAVAALLALGAPVPSFASVSDLGLFVLDDHVALFARQGRGGDDGPGDDNSGRGGSGGGSSDDDDDSSDDHGGSGSSGDDDSSDDNGGSRGDDSSSSDDNGGGSTDDASGSGRSKPRVPGGSGCDDPGDVAEHASCQG